MVDEITEIVSRAVHELLTSCLYKAEYWYWHKQQHSELWWDWGFPLSSWGYGQEHMHTHEHTHRHRVLWVRPFGQLLESWTLTPTCVLSPWEADGWCLFGFAVANAHTHTRCHDWNTQTRGRGRAGLPSLIPLSCVDFGLCLEIFVSFKFSISSLPTAFKTQLRLSSGSQETSQSAWLIMSYDCCINEKKNPKK